MRSDCATLRVFNILICSGLKIIFFSWTAPFSSSLPSSVKKDVLRNFAKFTGKHPCQSLFFNTVAGLRPVTLLKRRLWHNDFPVKFVKFLRTPFLQNTSGRLLLFFSCYTIFLTLYKSASYL